MLVSYFPIPTLTILSFSGSTLESPCNLLQLAAVFPHLSDLSLSYMKWRSINFIELPQLGLPYAHAIIRLDLLKVFKSFNARGLLRSLLARPFDTRLTRLEWELFDWEAANISYSDGDEWDRGRDEAPLMSAILQRSGSALKELRLGSNFDQIRHNIIFAT